MKWNEIQNTYPDQWLVIEAIDAYSTSNNIRHIDDISVVEKCPDGGSAMKIYRRFHKRFPEKEYYYIHTSREKLDFPERYWLGIRTENEDHIAK